jgi:hypothetical protein
MLQRWPWLVGAIVFLATLTGAYRGILPTPRIEFQRRIVATETGGLPLSQQPGPQLVLVFIGGANCQAARQPPLMAAVRRAAPLLQASAAGRGMSFAALGVSRDTELAVGVRYLEAVAGFDEIFVGRGWLNSAIVRYVWQDIPGAAATPQILVLERFVEGPEAGSEGRYAVENERLVRRKVGSGEIERWVAAGAPLPNGTSLATH